MRFERLYFSIRPLRMAAVFLLLGLGVMRPGLGQNTVSSAAPGSPVSPTSPLTDDERALHVLNRLAYGPAAGDLDQIHKSGVRAYIVAQLNPVSIPLPVDLQAQLNGLSTYQLTPAQIYQQYGPPSFAPNTASVEDRNQTRARAARELTPQTHEARIWQAVESPRQLQEVMTEFWFNHFNIFEGKDWDRYWIADFEKDAIRPNALGNFRQLLGAVAHHPAMLFYLDNWLSSGVNTPEAKGNFKGLNENYARELMELHTLGVDGGYSQADVITMARVLSGWTIDVNGMRQGRGNAGFSYNPRRHDMGSKVLLGQALPANGEQEGERALDMLAASPATAKFISTKLVEYFVSDQPDPALVGQLARRFQSSGGDIKAVLKVLFDSPQFWSRKNYQTQFKTPYQYVISSLRATATPVINVKPIDNELYQLGMPLYGWLTPEGYNYAQAVWLNPDAILRRINFASSLGNGKTPIAREAGVAVASTPALQASAPDPQQLLQTLGPMFSASALDHIGQAPRATQVSLMLGSPGFMKR